MNERWGCLSTIHYPLSIIRYAHPRRTFTWTYGISYCPPPATPPAEQWPCICDRVGSSFVLHVLYIVFSTWPAAASSIPIQPTPHPTRTRLELELELQLQLQLKYSRKSLMSHLHHRGVRGFSGGFYIWWNLTQDATGRDAGSAPSNKFRSILAYLCIYLASCPLPGSRPRVQYWSQVW